LHFNQLLAHGLEALAQPLAQRLLQFLLHGDPDALQLGLRIFHQLILTYIQLSEFLLLQLIEGADALFQGLAKTFDGQSHGFPHQVVVIHRLFRQGFQLFLHLGSDLFKLLHRFLRQLLLLDFKLIRLFGLFCCKRFKIQRLFLPVAFVDVGHPVGQSLHPVGKGFVDSLQGLLVLGGQPVKGFQEFLPDITEYFALFEAVLTGYGGVLLPTDAELLARPALQAGKGGLQQGEGSVQLGHSGFHTADSFGEG